MVLRPGDLAQLRAGNTCDLRRTTAKSAADANEQTLESAIAMFDAMRSSPTPSDMPNAGDPHFFGYSSVKVNRSPHLGPPSGDVA